MSAVEHLQFENAFQHLLINLATRFINQPVDEVDDAIIEAMRQVVEFLGANRASINQFDEENFSFSAIYRWQTASALVLPVRIKFADRRSFFSLLERGENILVSNRDDLPEDSSLRQFLAQLGIVAVVAVPVMRDNRLFGFVSAGWQTPVEMRPETCHLLKILGGIFLNTLERKQNEERIRKLNEDLEKRVEERTHELQHANNQLQNEIRERQQIEIMLRAGEERYRIISELISDYAFVYKVDPDGVFSIEWATWESYQRLTGHAFEDMNETNPFAVYHADDEALARADVARTIRGKKSNANIASSPKVAK